MTRSEFEAFMDVEGWSSDQKWQWRRITPLCDAGTFKVEMSRPNGFIEFRQEETGAVIRRVWKRMWETMPDIADARSYE
jgi:hypothetical protein